ncbi:bifunctional tRNA pseudouridine(32) synthase/23S rRNA pseudouridine(746) synthase RluA [Paraglaciecola agarilytica]|uniref:bifunctional tRNA pseudouridine(32) synthase/23S rRNA pseudouridine(746) synthase RluA n=1 Tax=Paraglaciecola chathamensis TaxID=368405 RepID=UPI001C07F1E8|nr:MULTISPECIES: bifunctional tRNA pseudouridine(32) synthase/23S rRNA pseudouridine(746) synthase RluA [Paraglaciecola]MBU3016814.1 bifunctional tRNA pseudouridine(32) synthase/23S rRNA pseudouridine(746) synthase RluA [Paraglaciecola agarilytica]MDO6559715.1 bifunctional tRNA pseudouridine(32) synthase/23S rRNA pseudouridine(746) synthase RluA [Paraglaciecola chathamensis]
MAIVNYAPPMRPYLNIVFKDEHLLVLNKPSGLLTVPGKALEHKDSLELRVQRVYPTAKIVHRLDMATSGLLVMALDKSTHRQLSKQFELRQTRKTYIARVYGEVSGERGSVDLPLICDWPNRPKQMVCQQRGKPSLTHWRVLERNDNSTRMELTPVTGRSHQLRVHMLSLGHPILGDRLYAHSDALTMAQRLQLHAQTLGFTHPVTELPLELSAPVPF